MDQDQDVQSVTTDTAGGTTAMQEIVPQVPKHLLDDTDRQTALLQQAKSQVDQAHGVVTDFHHFRQLGAANQKNAAHDLKLLDTRMATLLNDEDSSGVPQQLQALREKLQLINPHEAKKPQGAIEVVLSIFGIQPKIKKVLGRLRGRFNTVSEEIEMIEVAVSQGMDALLDDKVQLQLLQEKIVKYQQEVQEAGYMGQLAAAEIERRLPDITDPNERSAHQQGLALIMQRVRDLATMDQVFLQALTSTQILIDNNMELHSNADRTLTVVKPVLSVGLMITVALHRQKQVMGQVRATQQMAEDILVQNAANLKDQSAQIHEMQGNPVLAIEKVTTAYNDLVATMDQIDASRATTLQRAKADLPKLQRMTRDLDDRVTKYEAAKQIAGTSEPARLTDGATEGESE